MLKAVNLKTEYLKNPELYTYLNDPEEKAPLFFSLLAEA